MAKIRNGVPVQMPSGRIKIWDTEKAPHPLSHKQNGNRCGFLWHPYNSVKGKLFQLTLKPIIIQAIDRVWNELCDYDPESYIYDDETLFELNQVLTTEILDLFQDSVERKDWERAGIEEIGGTLRKQRIMLQLKDIFLFLMKEDVYYRPRLMELCKRTAPIFEGWEPTAEEMKYMAMGREPVKQEV